MVEACASVSVCMMTPDTMCDERRCYFFLVDQNTATAAPSR
jgi:hypothetical protein